MRTVVTGLLAMLCAICVSAESTTQPVPATQRVRGALVEIDGSSGIRIAMQQVVTAHTVTIGEGALIGPFWFGRAPQAKAMRSA